MHTRLSGGLHNVHLSEWLWFFFNKKKPARGLCSKWWPLFTPSNLDVAHARRIYSWNILKFLHVLQKLPIGVEERNMNECFLEGKLIAAFCLPVAGSQCRHWLKTVQYLLLSGDGSGKMECGNKWVEGTVCGAWWTVVQSDHRCEIIASLWLKFILCLAVTERDFLWWKCCL